jgi:DNA-binding GntR family transcriptional regulator
MEVVHIPDVPLRPVSRTQDGTLQKQVYEELHHSLMVGVFIPGQAVTLRALAGRLGTSPMPIRQAINRLIAEHALEMLPNRSVVVPRMSRQKFSELSMLRQTLEGMAAAEASRHAKPALVKKLKKVNAELLKVVEQRDVLRVLELNQQFHFTIYEASRYQVLVPMIESLWLQAGPFMYFSLSGPSVRWDTSRHKEAIAAIEAGDAKASRQAVEEDIGAMANYLLENISFSA